MKRETLEIRDGKDRTLLKIDEFGKIAVARFDDSSESDRQEVLSYYRAILEDNDNIEEKIEQIRKFIYFESDDDEFCS